MNYLKLLSVVFMCCMFASCCTLVDVTGRVVGKEFIPAHYYQYTEYNMMCDCMMTHPRYQQARYYVHVEYKQTTYRRKVTQYKYKKLELGSPYAIKICKKQ